MSAQTKTLLNSLTVRGLIVSLVGLIVTNFGVEADVELLTDGVIEIIGLLVQLIGLVAAFMGRLRADTPLR